MDALAIELLQSIDNSLKELLALSKSKRAVPATPSVNLDDQYGDPIVKAKDPKSWTGPTMKGQTFSLCPPEYLEMLADRYDYFASIEQDATKKRYNVSDAAKARGWATRIKSGWKPKTTEETPTW